MPQLSLYLDEDVLKELEIRARLSNTSISKFVITLLKSCFSKNWPDNFQSLYGSITDESFVKQEVPDWSMDTPRECL